MKFNQFRLLFFLAILIIFSSCLQTNTPIAVSSDASFVSLTIVGNDSVKKAVFTLEGTTIVNLDSLPFHTRIDSVFPKFNFKSTAYAKLFCPKDGLKYKFNKDSAIITGKDTVDFNQSNIYIKNYPTDSKSKYQIYYFKINVHKIQPELYVWKKVTDNVNSVNATSQKAIIFNDKIYYYLNDGTAAYLHTSTDGSFWNSGVSVSGLPVSTPLNDMTQFNGKLFLSRDGANIYSSTDGLNWIVKSVSSFTFKSLLFTLNGQLWATVQSVSGDKSYHFATSSDGDTWAMLNDVIPASFPVSDFAPLTFSAITGKSKAVVLGGYSQTGDLLKNCWSTEGEKVNSKYYWVDFSNENNSLDSLAAGASVISYDKKLLLFGKNNISNKTFYRESRDEGLSWQVPNKVFNQIALASLIKSPKTRKDTITYSGYYLPHVYQSVVVDKNSNISIIGGYVDKSILTAARRYNAGQMNSGNVNLIPVSDVWTGKLNRKSFLRQ